VTEQRVLVTGAAGFVGWHVARSLLEEGYAVTGVDSFDPFYHRSLKEANRRLLEAAHAVIHLAARPGVRQSVGAAPLYRALNETGTARLLDACALAGVRRVVFASSSSVYGMNAPVPFREGTALGRPSSPYAATKQAGERLVRRFVHATGGRAIILRLFSVYGPRQRPDLALQLFTGLLRAGRPVTVLGDGSAQRDYTHVTDVAWAVRRALAWTDQVGGACEELNIGSGRPIRLDCVVSELARCLGVEARLDRRDADPADLPVTWAEVEKARAILGFQPLVPLRAGIADFVAWHEREHGRQPRPAA
jgi:UDP-glucuronate 4-epimerase